ncbi:MAG TPA: DUF362 domain-containing protein [Anaerolineae bacterium]|nr:DUF362 domain-containing protein [Anaerolineae bacterium]
MSRDREGKQKLSRRAFLRAGVLTAGGWIAGCARPQPTPTEVPVQEEPAAATPLATATVVATATVAATATPTSVPPATATSVPTATEAPPTATGTTAVTAKDAATPTGVPPTATAEPTITPSATPTAPPPTATPLVAVPSRQELIAHYPQVGQSAVSLVQHEGAWAGDEIQRPVVLQMLDAALVELTGIGDALAAWRALFDPGEMVGIKVNTISRYTTSPAVAYAVAQRLQDAGLPAEQIVIFDRTDWELRDRGFALDPDGPGVRCRGAKAWESPADVSGSTQRIHDVMLSCDALINIPALKQHGDSGFTSAMKNHYGTVSNPGQLHGNNCDPYIPAVNALPVIRDKTRLIVGDFIRICPYDWNRMSVENKIAMSFDPVAHDIVARQVLVNRRAADGQSAGYIEGKSHYIEAAVGQGLGADAAHLALREKRLG